MESISIKAMKQNILINPQLIKLYRQAEAYFFKSISIQYLNFDEDITAYMTGVPVANLNPVYIQKISENLPQFLKKTEQFYQQNNLPFIIVIPQEFCSAEIKNILQTMHYYSTEKSVAMAISLVDRASISAMGAEYDIRANNNKLEDWMIPLIEAFESTVELSSKYAQLHKLALEKQFSLQHFSIYDKEKPVTSATLSHQHNFARIDDMSTLPKFQRKGYASCLITYILAEAKKLNAKYCFLEASEAGLSIYQKLGFKSLFINNIYLKQT